MNAISITPLHVNELYEINAGESVWYYVFYGIGWFAHAYTDGQLSMTEAVGNGRR